MDVKLKLLGVLLLILITPTVNAVPPVANFSADVTYGSAPLPVSFTDSSLNNPLGWAWFFGDEEYTTPWTLVNANASWLARKAHCSVVMPDGSIILMGGRVTGVGNMNDVWRSKDNGTTWTQVTANAEWSARDASSSVVLPDGSIVLMGGKVKGGGYENDVWRSEDNGTTWTQVNANTGWTAREGHCSIAMPDGSIVLMGGRNSSDAIHDVWQSMDNGTTWTQVTANAEWSARDAFSSVVLPDGSIVLMGGSSLDHLNNDVWRSTDDGATWTQLTAKSEWKARQFPSSVVMPDGSIVLMGGWVGRKAENDVWRSIDNGTTWTKVTENTEWTGRERFSSVVLPDGSIVLMGGDEGGNNKNDVWRLIPAGSYAQNPSHTYTQPGTYQVTLQVYNTDGYNSIRKTGYLTVTKKADKYGWHKVIEYIQNFLPP